MKKLTLFFASFLFAILITPVSAITRDELARRFFLADNPESINEVSQLAMANLNVVEEILTTPMSDHTARLNAFSCLLSASQNALIEKGYFFDLAFNQIKNIRTYTLSTSVEGELKIFSNMVTSYSIKPGLINDVLGNFESFYPLLSSMLNMSLIDNHGVKNSLESKVKNAQKDFERGNKGPAINILNAAINEISAQSGKNINAQGALILKGYINNLVVQIERQ